MIVKETIDSIMGPLERALTTKTVIGEPTQVGNITLIPVIDITFGFGAGGGEGTDKGQNAGTGGGGGAGGRVSPKAVIVIKDGEVSIMSFSKGGPVDKILESLPGLVDKFTGAREKKESE